MAKRFLSLLLAMLLAGTLIPSFSAASSSSWTMYVYTDNGKTLNVRSDPVSGNNIIGRLNFGSAVSVRLTMANGWTCIDYPAGMGGVAYVQSRFLVSTQPGWNPGGSSSGGSSSGSYSQALSSMNAEFRSARKVSPYTIVSRPSRASGWVNLRWAPSMEAEVITTCRQGKELTVLAELNSWYQVEDPSTGMVGFISRSYVYRK